MALSNFARNFSISSASFIPIEPFKSTSPGRFCGDSVVDVVSEVSVETEVAVEVVEVGVETEVAVEVIEVGVEIEDIVVLVVVVGFGAPDEPSVPDVEVVVVFVVVVVVEFEVVVTVEVVVEIVVVVVVGLGDPDEPLVPDVVVEEVPVLVESADEVGLDSAVTKVVIVEVVEVIEVTEVVAVVEVTEVVEVVAVDVTGGSTADAFAKTVYIITPDGGPFDPSVTLSPFFKTRSYRLKMIAFAPSWVDTVISVMR